MYNPSSITSKNEQSSTFAARFMDWTVHEQNFTSSVHSTPAKNGHHMIKTNIAKPLDYRKNRVCIPSCSGTNYLDHTTRSFPVKGNKEKCRSWLMFSLLYKRLADQHKTTSPTLVPTCWGVLSMFHTQSPIGLPGVLYQKLNRTKICRAISTEHQARHSLFWPCVLLFFPFLPFCALGKAVLCS